MTDMEIASYENKLVWIHQPFCCDDALNCRGYPQEGYEEMKIIVHDSGYKLLVIIIRWNDYSQYHFIEVIKIAEEVSSTNIIDERGAFRETNGQGLFLTDYLYKEELMFTLHLRISRDSYYSYLVINRDVLDDLLELYKQRFRLT